jgi:exonuclease III
VVSVPYSHQTSELNAIVDQMDLTDIYRIFHPKAAEYTFFSVTRGTFSKIDHILGHKGSLNKYKQIEITSSML